MNVSAIRRRRLAHKEEPRMIDAGFDPKQLPTFPKSIREKTAKRFNIEVSYFNATYRNPRKLTKKYYAMITYALALYNKQQQKDEEYEQRAITKISTLLPGTKC